jgi:hypothetical protein
MSKLIKNFEYFKRSYIFLHKTFLWEFFFLKITTLYVCVCVCVCMKGVWRYYRMFVNADIISMRKSHHRGAICTVYWELKMFYSIVDGVSMLCVCTFLICFYVEYVWWSWTEWRGKDEHWQWNLSSGYVTKHPPIAAPSIGKLGNLYAVNHLQIETRGVSHCVALPFTLRSIFKQKKNYGNSNISPCKNIIFKISSWK